jgi:two-component system invasion response regulator UvrY
MTVRVMLVDDHAVVRSGYRRLIDAEPDMRLVAEAENASQACAALREHAIDVVVMDLSLREGSGLDAIARLLARQPQLRVLVFSMHQSAGHVTQALRNGALGYISKNADPQEMIDAIRTVAQGRKVFSADVAQVLAGVAVQHQNPLQQLTPREFDILRLFIGGQGVNALGEQLNLSPKTVHNHLSNIRNKLDVDSEMALLLLAARHGLVKLPDSASAA